MNTRDAVSPWYRPYWEPWIATHPGCCMAIVKTPRGTHRMCRNGARFLAGWEPFCGRHVKIHRRYWPDDPVVPIALDPKRRYRYRKPTRRR